MIYTLTLNPAIDLFIDTPQLQKDVVNRTHRFDIQANGKGVNVSFILKRLGLENTALGVGGGFTLDYIASELTKSGISNHFLKVTEPTRINVFTHVDDGSEYKLVNPGPQIPTEVIHQLLATISDLTSNDTLIISGSFSAGIDPHIIVDIARISNASHFQLIIDTSYKTVLDTLKYHPLLLKPNNEELAAWFNETNVDNPAVLIQLGQKLIQQGAHNVLISRGKNGALLINRHHVWSGNAPQINVLNTAGAGDTMLGTFVAKAINRELPEISLKYAIAAGSDTARNSWITDFSNLEELLKQIHIEEIGGN